MLNDVNESSKEIINVKGLNNGKLDLTSCNLIDFLKTICNQASLTFSYNKEEICAAAETLNENKNKTKDTVDYVLNSDENKIDALMPNQLPVFDGLGQLLQHKIYIILCLIEFGINPFEIKRCIELNSSSSTDFKWNKFLETIEKYRKKWFFVFTTNQRDNAVKIFDAIVIVELINIFKDLLNQKNNSNQVDIKAAIGIFKNYFSDSENTSLWRFILFYLNENMQVTKETQAIKEFLLGVPNGFIFKKYLDDESKNKLQEANKKELSLFDITSKCSGTSGKYFEEVDIQSDFKDLFKMLDPVLISIFALILMRRISFINEQMSFIASKINNDQVMTTLRQINQSLDYKKSNVDTWRCNGKNNDRHVKFGSITHGLDYLFLKISRGIGYSGAILWAFVHFIPYSLAVAGLGLVCAYMNATCAGFLYLLIPFWGAFAICGGVFLLIFTVIYIIRHFSQTQLFSWRAEACSFRNWWSKFPDKMQNFYNQSKVVRWLELYNIKHPTNNVELPPQRININFSNDPTGGCTDLSKLRESDINGNNTTKILPKSVFNENKISEPTKTNPQIISLHKT